MLKLFSKLIRGKIRKTYEIEVPASERYLGDIRTFISDICLETGFSSHEINNIKLAIDEACSNVVRHAYKGLEPGMIQLLVKRRDREVEIYINDKGKSFEWKKARTPDLNRYVEIGKKGGLGIWFIRKLMDETDYKSGRQGNTLRLVKRSKHAKALDTAVVQPSSNLPVPSRLKRPSSRGQVSVRTKFLVSATASVAVLVLIIFAYMFTNQAKSLRNEMMTNVEEMTKRLAQEARVYLLRLDDLHMARLVKTIVKTDQKINYAFILDQDNKIWAHSTTNKMFQEFKPPAKFRFPEKSQVLVQTLTNEQQEKVYDLSFPIYLESMRLGTAHVGLKEATILREIKTGRRDAIIIFIIALALSTSGAYFLMTFLVSPIRKLTDGMLAVSDGRLDHRIVIESNDEFGQIASVFNDMAHRFQSAQKNLLEQERIQQEMQVAQEIQHTLLPRETPKIEGYDLASMYRSAKEVGGDYFDYVWVDENILGIAVADVSGKGIPGSLVMTMIRTALRLEARTNHSATDVMDKVNTFVTRDMRKGMFVTMFYIVLDSRRRVINFSSAGHNPMILYREETDQVYFLKPRGFPLGIDLPNPDLFGKSLTQESVKLKKGDLLLLYTDGITEAMNPERDQYGEQRLVDFMRTHHKLSAEEFVAKLNQDITEFTRDYPQNDDITAVAIKEGMMADDLQFEIRRKLFYLVEKQGVPVRTACKAMNVSPSTFYRLKKIRDQHGVKALKSTIMRKDDQIQQVSLAEQRLINEVVIKHPEYGVTRIVQQLGEMEGAGTTINEKMVYHELKRLRLTTKEARELYAAKKKVD